MAAVGTHDTPLTVSAATLEKVCACSNKSEFDCWLALRDVKADESDHDQKRVLELLCLVMSLNLQAKDKERPYQFHEKEIASDSSFLDLLTLSAADFPDLVQARICDILWVLKKHFPSAKKAVECYLRLAEKTAEKTYDPEKWVSSIQYTRRASIIAMQLGKDNDCVKSVVVNPSPIG